MATVAATFAENQVSELTNRQKILIGGAGALTPIVLNLIVVDLKTTLSNLTIIVFLGYLLRVVGLFYLGGIIAYFHKDERNALKLFELGIVAPALITAVMNGSSAIKETNVRAGNAPPTVSAGLLDNFIPTAYARESDPAIAVYSPPEESVSAQLWRGISGAQTERVWYVIAGTYNMNQLEKALALVRRIQATTPEYKPKIFKNDKYYAVAIGCNLTLRNAKARMQEASEAKVPKDGDLYLYNPWETK